MHYGISALYAHLSARSSPPDPLEIDWRSFKAWNYGHSPEFAGRYFLGQPYLWAHGEASLAKEVVDIQYIVPIQHSNPDRQKASGDDGEKYGREDASAFCEQIYNCLWTGELSIVQKSIAVYLEVEDGTQLSDAYWTNWSSRVHDFTVVILKDREIGGEMVSMPSFSNPFLPCICCQFVQSAAGSKYRPTPEVTAAIESTGKKLGGKQSRCYGFWARVTDKAAYHAPEPTLDWTIFEGYIQPQGASGGQPVPVFLWRYMDSYDPTKPEIDQMDRMTLDAAYEAPGGASLSGLMLRIEDWKLGIRVGGNDTVRTPEEFGIDRGRPVSAQIACLSRTEMRIRELPATQNNHGIAVDLRGKTSFAIRYYSGAPGSPSSPKDLTLAEARAISRTGVKNVACWQARKTFAQAPDHLLTADQGIQDARDAFAYAANVIHQPPYTPIYFAVDALVSIHNGTVPIGGTTAPVPTVMDIINYFQDISYGYLSYLQAQKDAKLEQVPYYTGVYASGNVLDACYIYGLCTHFWQAWPPNWGDNPSTEPNRPVWPHNNIWQVLLWDTRRPDYWAQNAAIKACAGADGVDLNIAWGDFGGWKI